MARKLTDDNIRIILDIEAKGVYAELQQLSSQTIKYTEDNKKLKSEIKNLEKQIEESQNLYNKLRKEGKVTNDDLLKGIDKYNRFIQTNNIFIEENNKKIEENNNKTKELIKTMSLQDMTMSQLKQRAADLQQQMNTTSASLSPEAYAKLQKDLAEVNNRMSEVQNAGKSMLDQFASMNNPVGSAAKAVQGFIQVLNYLKAHPIVGVLVIVAALFMKLKDSIAQNEEAMNSLNRIMAPIKTFFDWLIENVLKLVNLLLKLAEDGFGGIMRWLEKIPGVGKHIAKMNEESEKAINLEKEKQALVERHRDNIVAISEKEQRIAKLREEASRKDLFSAAERIKKLEEAKDLELEIVDIKRQEAQAELNILNLATEKVKATTEWKNQIAEATAKLNKIDTEYYTKDRALSRTLSAAKIENQRNAVDAAKKALEERLKNEENALNQEINLLKQSRFEGIITEKEYNKQVEQLTIESLNRKINIKGQEKDKILQLEAQILDAQIKQQAEADKDLLYELKKAKDNQLALLESAKNTQLQHLQDTESDQKIYALRAAEIEAEASKAREDVIRSFGQTLEQAEFQNNKIRLDAIEKNGNEIIDAESANLKEQEKLRKLFAKTTADFERLYNIKTWEQRKEDELRILEKQHAAGLLSTETYQLAVKAVEEKYKDEKLKVRQQYGISNLKEHYNAELELLNEQYENKLLTVEQYEQALLNIKLKYAEKHIQMEAELIQSGANIVKGIEEMKTAQIGAEYTKRQSALTEQYNQGIISQEEYNAQKEQLDYEQKKKELDLQKKYADVNFAVQVAQIIASTALAAIQSFAAMSSIPIVGPVLGAVAAAAAVAAGAIQIAKAKAERDRVKSMTLESPGGGGSSMPSTGEIRLRDGFAEGGYNMSDGGYTKPGAKYEVAGYIPVHGGEYVIASDELKKPVIADMARTIEKERRKRTNKNAVSGMADGGSNTPDGFDSAAIGADGHVVSRMLAVLERLENGQINVQTNYGITEMEAEQKRKMEAESKFTKAS